jgi:hypothetical protein
MYAGSTPANQANPRLTRPAVARRSTPDRSTSHLVQISRVTFDVSELRILLPGQLG